MLHALAWFSLFVVAPDLFSLCESVLYKVLTAHVDCNIWLPGNTPVHLQLSKNIKSTSAPGHGMELGTVPWHLLHKPTAVHAATATR